MIPFHVKLLQDVTLKLSFYNNIEQRHPQYPNYEVNISLENMTVTASDYILQSMLRLKDKVLANMNPPPPQETRKKGAPSRGGTESISGSMVSKAIIIEEIKEEGEGDLMAKMKELNVGEENIDKRASNRQSVGGRGSQMVKRMSK
jgi:hypothetical protein